MTNSSPHAPRSPDFAWLDAHDQAALLRRGECTALELTEACIQRIERLDGELNAVSVRAFDAARARASRSGGATGMSGVPYLLKDSLDYPGMPTACGSRVLAGSAPVAKGHPYVERLDSLGLIPLGKTNVPEFSLLPTTEGVLFGSARNPWSVRHSAGGSSGGAAVAVASGMVPLAHAADGGGSIRIPASCCGLVGLKATRGSQLRARGPHFIEDLLVADGLLARSVRDVAWSFRALQPGEPGDAAASELPKRPPSKLRIRVVERNLFGEMPHAQVSDTLRRAADLCASLGHDVATAGLPVDGPAVANAFRTIWTYLGNDVVNHCRALLGGRADALLEEWTLGLGRITPRFGPADVEQVFAQMVAASHGLDQWFGSHDVLLTPVLNDPPPPLGLYDPQQRFETLFETMFRYVSYTPMQNLTGHPALSLPLFQSPDGLPIGSMLTAAKGREDVLFALARQLEEALPWAGRRPPHGA
jgi:amidase